MRLTMTERQSLVRVTAPRYQKAPKKEKSTILDEFQQLTHYARCYASYVLSRHGRKSRVDRHTTLIGDFSKRVRNKRQLFYGPAVLDALRTIWAMLGYLCGKRLKAALTEVVPKLERWAEIDLNADTKRKLQSISAATIDRMLKADRKRLELKSRCQTKPGTLLKYQVPIRTFAEWDESKPGFVEVDLVSHGGGDERGDFCQTLTVTDVCSVWTEAQAVKNKAQVWVFEALTDIRKRLPFPLLGIDSDNGGEFINSHLVNYCKQQGITFTRSRPYRKNDNCYVEEKNYTVVRKAVGYRRYDSPQELTILNRLYCYVGLLTNYFLPSMKLASKHRVGSKVIKRYDAPQTPYARLLGSADVAPQVKKRLKDQYVDLNPAQLSREISNLQRELFKAHERKLKKRRAG